MIADAMAQVADTANSNPLFVYGPLGIMVAWFMYLVQSIAKQFVTDLKTGIDGMRAEIRTLGHRFKGMEMAMLAEVSTRPDAPIAVKKFATAEIAKLKAQEEPS